MRPVMMTLAVFALTCTAWQEPPPSQRGRGGQDRGGDRPARQNADRPGTRDFVRDLQTDLKLTDAQRPDFERFATEFQKGIQSLRQERGNDGERLRDQIRAARQAGDTERAEQLQTQAREGMRKLGELRKTFLDNVATILTDDQKKVLETYRTPRDRRGEGRGRRDGQAGWDDWTAKLPEALKMTAEQHGKFDKLVAERRTALDANRERVGPLVEEMREAREAGNNERVRELRGQIEEARAEAGGPDAFLSQLDPILTPAQREQLAAMPKPGESRARGADPRRVLATADRLDLTPEQKDRLREIGKTFRENAGRLSQDRDERQAQADALIAEIKAILTPEQTREFDQLLDRAERRAPRGPRGQDNPPDENADPLP